MHSNNDDSVLYLFLAAVVVFLVSVFALSRWIGADFSVTLEAALQSIVFVLVAGALVYFLSIDILPCATGLLAVLWPLWWKVVDSIATGGKAVDMLFMYQTPWWGTDATKWIFEGVLIVATIVLYVRSRDRYGY